RVADAGVPVPEIGIAERARRLQKEDVVTLAVIGQPEIPEPVIRKHQHVDRTPFVATFRSGTVISARGMTGADGMSNSVNQAYAAVRAHRPSPTGKPITRAGRDERGK